MIAENIGRGVLAAVWAAQVGSPEAREAFILANEGLAYSLAFKAHPEGCEREDVSQAALCGLIRAVDTFDPLRGCAFSTHANWRIQKEIKMLYARAPSASVPSNTFWVAVRACQTAGEDMPAAMQPAASMDSARVEDGRTLADVLGQEGDQDEGAARAWRLVALVDVGREILARARDTEKGREMLGLRLDVLAYRIAPVVLGAEPITLAAIGDAHDLTRERIRQIEEGILPMVRARLSEAL